ncbi:hypothetical protein RIF29_15769 [Crotalaria pallida]|uniref:Uncharacterized protein n=1 Tax=Crotalaria pallida TaxID=3830 RepID=A0AAN9ICW5_CROPI
MGVGVARLNAGAPELVHPMHPVAIHLPARDVTFSASLSSYSKIEIGFAALSLSSYSKIEICFATLSLSLTFFFNFNLQTSN